MRRWWVLCLATVGGAGFFPVASGTFASLLAMPLYYGLRGSVGLYVAVTVLCCAVGVWAAGAAEAYLGEKDPHAVVIDEIAGYLISAAFLPSHIFYPIAAFFLFRLFDIWKPFPARQSQALPGGWGIMIDDVIAGIYANALLQLCRLFLPW
jgi:phosphatidylglycerophosphatase A